MNTDKEIKKLERKIALLRASSVKHDARRKKTALRRVMSVLKKYGYRTVQELLEIADTVAVVTASKRTRTKITEPLRKKVISALKAGKSGSVVAKMHKISTATVNNIKKAAGLTKSKKVGAVRVPSKNPKQVLRRAEGPTKRPKPKKKAGKKPNPAPTAESVLNEQPVHKAE